MPKRKHSPTPPLSNTTRDHEYLSLCSQFAEITSTNNALAMAFLQDTDWDLERALADFFAEHRTEEHSVQIDHIDLTETSSEDVPITLESNAVECTVFNVLSWNVDGLDTSNLVQRTDEIVSRLKSEPFHVVCFQEVTMVTLPMFRTKLEKDYLIFSPTDLPFSDCVHYFVTIMIRRHPAIEVDRNSFLVHSFPNSVMGRHLVSIKLNINSAKLTDQPTPSTTISVRIFTAHLESCRESSAERKNQLAYAWTRMKHFGPPSENASNEHPRASIFCGDLNLRDKEVEELGGVPPDITDVWLATGSRLELCATWDPRRNTNASRLVGGGPRRYGSSPIFRYDRMYVHGAGLKPVDFGLRGLEKVPGAACFPSDHWGILGRFQLDTVSHTS
ncbi:Traf and tnf receptor associated protein [Fasciola gigantica]|uniref:Traf and tnf receptor associated protein n=1 Tax=Fasciola gigantica TaxID=46835 RepID=A0A504ZBR0_FASGI|nr:Traf and tnf receptor associated protein [Fasciola gigantica]